MAIGETDYWALGLTTTLGLAQSGVFGGDIRKLTNPQSAVSKPMVAPPPAPVAGQQAMSPIQSTMQPGIAGHLARNWGKYAIGAGVFVVLAVVLMRRKG